MAHEGKYGIVLTEPPFADDDEPIFILRAKDITSGAVLREYKNEAFRYGALDPFLAEIDEVIERFTKWQKDNQELTKVPD